MIYTLTMTNLSEEIIPIHSVKETPLIITQFDFIVLQQVELAAYHDSQLVTCVARSSFDQNAPDG